MSITCGVSDVVGSSGSIAKWWRMSKAWGRELARTSAGAGPVSLALELIGFAAPEACLCAFSCKTDRPRADVTPKAAAARAAFEGRRLVHGLRGEIPSGLRLGRPQRWLRTTSAPPSLRSRTCAVDTRVQARDHKQA